MRKPSKKRLLAALYESREHHERDNLLLTSQEVANGLARVMGDNCPLCRLLTNPAKFLPTCKWCPLDDTKVEDTAPDGCADEWQVLSRLEDDMRERGFKPSDRNTRRWRAAVRGMTARLGCEIDNLEAP